ncbi:MAG: crotonase/enoyl-CoA hydratase family protein [Acidimicrobiia bacterium]|nr:crotonase/enoyl-CoA hydratase family protein [Acidimicrobiia bacterium]
MSERVTATITDGVADVRLNRPEKLNALDPAMFQALIDTGEALKADPSVRAVVLSGEGRSFCAGLDLESFQAMASKDVSELTSRRPPTVYDTAQAAGQQAVYVWREIPAPVIAAVRGHALGGGFQLALGADLRIVAPDAQLSVLEVRWGLIPDMTGTQLLPPLVGLERAKELTFTGRTVSGEEAVAIGLALRTSDDPLAEALAFAGELATKSPGSLRGSKHLLNLAGTVPLAEGFAEEQRVIRSLIGTPNQVEAVRAFFEKRPARFDVGS